MRPNHNRAPIIPNIIIIIDTHMLSWLILLILIYGKIILKKFDINDGI